MSVSTPAAVSPTTKPGTWIVTHETLPITVKGKSRSGAEERLRVLVTRYHQLTEQMKTIDPKELA